MVSKKTKISARRFYTLSEIVREGLIPGIDNVVKASRLVQTDSVTNQVLQGVKVPRGFRGVQYQVRGSNIIKFLANLDDYKRI